MMAQKFTETSLRIPKLQTDFKEPRVSNTLDRTKDLGKINVKGKKFLKPRI